MNDLEADLLIANAKIKQLEQQLAASQRETQAAAEFITSLREDSDGDWGDLVFMIDEWLKENRRGPHDEKGNAE